MSDTTKTKIIVGVPLEKITSLFQIAIDPDDGNYEDTYPIYLTEEQFNRYTNNCYIYDKLSIFGSNNKAILGISFMSFMSGHLFVEKYELESFIGLEKDVIRLLEIELGYKGPVYWYIIQYDASTHIEGIK